MDNKYGAALPELIAGLQIFRRNVQHFSGRLQDGFECRYAESCCFSYLFEVEEEIIPGIWFVQRARQRTKKEGCGFCGQPVCPKEVIPSFFIHP